MKCTHIRVTWVIETKKFGKKEKGLKPFTTNSANQNCEPTHSNQVYFMIHSETG